MKRIAFHTLGCKVNQYDTQAMRELFEGAGYRSADGAGQADVYLVNTCTVTGTGDNKSLKLVRRLHREHPDAQLIVAGCLAQRDAELVKLPGVRLVIGTRHRARVVELFERALGEDSVLLAVEDESDWQFEPLTVSRHEGKTRAVMKIQEGCDRYCTYCIIPYVRGPVRSMPLEDVAREAHSLAQQGYKEIVLTGIHLASYGRQEGHSLIDAIRAVHGVEGVLRIRLGSLEPTLMTQTFVEELWALPKVCAQFHLSMQSGSAGVLRRMGRRYTPEEYAQAAQRLREAFVGCALTTDVLTGFPGETEQEAQETLDFVVRMGFARIHVFPYSPREGTAAARMQGLPEDVKRARAAQLLAVGNQLEEGFVKNCVGTIQEVLFEKRLPDGLGEGYSDGYVRVLAQAEPGVMARVRIDSASGTTAMGTPV